jgi:tetratricopeptide (TPR) repeat protein
MPQSVQSFRRFPCDAVQPIFRMAFALLFAFVWIDVAIGDDRDPRAAASGTDSAGNNSGDKASANQPASKDRIAELIRQLGSPQFAVRRAAAIELRQIGAEAFDMLNAATDDADLEVASSARYLLRQITVRWVRGEDSATVRGLLHDYANRPDETRLEHVETLARLTNGDGIAALCRIARFDRSPLVSRAAALEIIRPREYTTKRVTLDPDTAERELGDSSREAAAWLRQYVEQLRDPAAALAGWQKFIDEESAKLEAGADETTAVIVLGLVWNLADLHRQLDDARQLSAAVDRMIDLDADDSEDTTTRLLAWLTKHKSWPALDEMLAKHEDRLQQSKRALYSAALARARQGQSEAAEKLAQKAVTLEPQAPLESFITAHELEEHSQFDWAVREYRRSVGKEPVESNEGILARVYLASLLHDYEKHEEAAEALEPLVKAVQGEGRVGQIYSKWQDYYEERGLALPKADALAARMHYYRAWQYHNEADYRRERDSLELAIRFDPEDADVLIAMYRLPDADERWREQVRRRIRDLAQSFQQEIDANPSDPTAYNQWAWLIGNTEGDFQKAIRYSHRSLELIPPDAGEAAGGGFLDTLGRCYYAAGDYENAVKYQREAVEKVDYMQVMHRQLALFEKALAEKQGAGSGEQGAETQEQGAESEEQGEDSAEQEAGEEQREKSAD